MTTEKPNANIGIQLTQPGTEPPPQTEVVRSDDANPIEIAPSQAEARYHQLNGRYRC
jgi:hypothetical protein